MSVEEQADRRLGYASGGTMAKTALLFGKTIRRT